MSELKGCFDLFKALQHSKKDTSILLCYSFNRFKCYNIVSQINSINKQKTCLQINMSTINHRCAESGVWSLYVLIQTGTYFISVSFPYSRGSFSVKISRTWINDCIPGEVLPVWVPLLERWAVVHRLTIAQAHHLIDVALPVLPSISEPHQAVPTGALSVAYVSVLQTEKTRGRVRQTVRRSYICYLLFIYFIVLTLR